MLRKWVSSIQIELPATWRMEIVASVLRTVQCKHLLSREKLYFCFAWYRIEYSICYICLLLLRDDILSWHMDVNQSLLVSLLLSYEHFYHVASSRGRVCSTHGCNWELDLAHNLERVRPGTLVASHPQIPLSQTFVMEYGMVETCSSVSSKFKTKAMKS